MQLGSGSSPERRRCSIADLGPSRALVGSGSSPEHIGTPIDLLAGHVLRP